MNILKTIGFCFLYAVLNVTGAALIKKELPFHNLNQVKGFLSLIFTWRVVLGFFIILISSLVMFKALSIGRFSYILPIATGINFSLTILLGILIFSDKLTKFSFIGLLLILVGIIFMNIKTT